MAKRQDKTKERFAAFEKCPTCGAEAGEPCKTPKGRPKYDSVHSTRPFNLTIPTTLEKKPSEFKASFTRAKCRECGTIYRLERIGTSAQSPQHPGYCCRVCENKMGDKHGTVLRGKSFIGKPLRDILKDAGEYGHVIVDEAGHPHLSEAQMRGIFKRLDFKTVDDWDMERLTRKIGMLPTSQIPESEVLEACADEAEKELIRQLYEDYRHKNPKQTEGK